MNQYAKVMDEYDEDEIGALDHEEVTGRLDPNNRLLETAVSEFLKNQENDRYR